MNDNKHLKKEYRKHHFLAIKHEIKFRLFGSTMDGEVCLAHLEKCIEIQKALNEKAKTESN